MSRHGTAKQRQASGTLKGLCPEDKEKVAKLIKQVVELGQEKQRLQDALDQHQKKETDKLKQLQECNKQVVQDNAMLKGRLAQLLTLLRMYHHKVQVMDAALHALQPHAQGKKGGQISDHTAQQQPAFTLCSPGIADTAETEPCSPKCSSAEGSEQAPQHAANTTTAHASQALQPSPRQEQEQQQTPPRPQQQEHGSREHSALVQDLVPSTMDAVPVTPVLLHGGGQLARAVDGLLQWQVEQGLLTPQQMAEARSKVLRYDPSIGQHGAFYFADVAADVSGLSSHETSNMAAEPAAVVRALDMAGAVSMAFSDLAEGPEMLRRTQAPADAGAGAGAPEHDWASNTLSALGEASPWRPTYGSSMPGASARSTLPSHLTAQQRESGKDSPTAQQLLSIAHTFDSLAEGAPSASIYSRAASAAPSSPPTEPWSRHPAEPSGPHPAPAGQPSAQHHASAAVGRPLGQQRAAGALTPREHTAAASDRPAADGGWAGHNSHGSYPGASGVSEFAVEPVDVAALHVEVHRAESRQQQCSSGLGQRHSPADPQQQMEAEAVKWPFSVSTTVCALPSRESSACSDYEYGLLGRRPYGSSHQLQASSTAADGGIPPEYSHGSQPQQPGISAADAASNGLIRRPLAPVAANTHNLQYQHYHQQQQQQHDDHSTAWMHTVGGKHGHREGPLPPPHWQQRSRAPQTQAAASSRSGQWVWHEEPDMLTMRAAPGAARAPAGSSGRYDASLVDVLVDVEQMEQSLRCRLATSSMPAAVEHGKVQSGAQGYCNPHLQASHRPSSCEWPEEEGPHGAQQTMANGRARGSTAYGSYANSQRPSSSHAWLPPPLTELDDDDVVSLINMMDDDDAMSILSAARAPSSLHGASG